MPSITSFHDESIISGLPNNRRMSKKNEMKIQQLQQQLELLQKYNDELDEKLAEYLSTKESLTEMQQVKKHTPLFVPVAPSFFAKVNAESFQELLVAVAISETLAVLCAFKYFRIFNLVMLANAFNVFSNFFI